MDDDEYTGTDQSDMVKEYVYKVVVVGNYSVGKTTLIKRLMSARLPPESDHGAVEDIRVSPTIGTDFFSHVVEDVTPGQNVRLQIWDTAGLQRYATVHESTYRNASLVLCVFDVTDVHSLEDLMERHLTTASDYIPNLEQQNLIFIANKIDLLTKGSGATGAARQKALVENARRAASPEAAFTHAGQDANSGTGFGASGEPQNGSEEDEPVDIEAIVTMADLQTQVFSILPDANYVEVSAKTGQSVDEALSRICQAALFTDHALPAGWDPLRQSREALQHSTLPENRVVLRAAGLFREAGRSSPTPAPTTTVPATTRPTAELDTTPLPTPDEKEHTAVPNERLRATPASAGSWRQSGAFSFDMAPPNELEHTVNFNSDVFSPAERDEHGDHEDGAAARPALSPRETPAQRASSPPGASGGSDARVLTAEERRLLRTPVSQLTPQQREARRALEHEEMKGLIGRGNANKSATQDGLPSSEPPSLGGSTATQKPSRVFADLDAEDRADQTRGDDTGRKPFRSILDDEEERRAAERAANEPRDSDDDAVDFQERLRARMDEIDKDAALKKIELKRSNDRDKADKKKKKKAEKAVGSSGKCGGCQCS